MRLIKYLIKIFSLSTPVQLLSPLPQGSQVDCKLPAAEQNINPDDFSDSSVPEGPRIRCDFGLSQKKVDFIREHDEIFSQ